MSSRRLLRSRATSFSMENLLPWVRVENLHFSQMKDIWKVERTFWDIERNFLDSDGK